MSNASKVVQIVRTFAYTVYILYKYYSHTHTHTHAYAQHTHTRTNTSYIYIALSTASRVIQIVRTFASPSWCAGTA